MIEKKYLIQAFQKKEKWESFDIEMAQSVKEKVIQNAIMSYGLDIKPEEIILLCNATITGSGKKGYFFTENAIYGTIGDLKNKPISLEGLISVQKGKRDSYLRFVYQDGTCIDRYTSIYDQDITYIIQEARKIKNEEEQLETDTSQQEFEMNSQSLSKQKVQKALSLVTESEQQALAELEGNDANAENRNIITLTTDSGTKCHFEFLDLISYRKESYVVLLPIESNGKEEGEDVVILKVETDKDDYESYLPVDSQETLTAVFELFKERFQNDITFIDEEKSTIDYDTAPIPYNGEKPYIFISYSHKDSQDVFKIISKLQQDGCYVWYDEGIDPGSEWDDNIASHIEKCGCMLAFISKNYLNSENCRDELSYARDLSINRLLIYLEDVDLPSGMAMRMNRLQAVYYCRYNVKELFYQKLYASRVMISFISQS